MCGSESSDDDDEGERDEAAKVPSTERPEQPRAVGDVAGEEQEDEGRGESEGAEADGLAAAEDAEDYRAPVEVRVGAGEVLAARAVRE